jgi:hypothetical protein
MAESIAIKDIHLTPVPPDHDQQPVTPLRVSWFDLSVTLKNASDAGPLYVVSEACGLRYDAGRRVLHVQFSEKDAPDRRLAAKVPPPPNYCTVAPGGETVIKYRLASPITFFEESPEGGARKPTIIHIPADIDAVECIIAYGDTPPPREINLASLNPLSDRRGWGATIARTVPISKDGPKAKP